MTCIAAVVEDGKVWMGGDSLRAAGWSRSEIVEPKVALIGEFLVGSAGYARWGQILRYAFTPPPLTEGEKLERYLATRFVDSLRTCLKDAGHSVREGDRESNKDNGFLLGFRGRLFRFCSHYSFTEEACFYDAEGCGEEFALGALFATEGKPAKERIEIALQAAERHSAGVRGPFTILSTP